MHPLLHIDKEKKWKERLEEKELEIQRNLQKYHDHLQEMERNEAERSQELLKYCNQLHQKERNEEEKEKEIQRYRDQLQQKERNEAEKEEEMQRYRDQLQQKERNETEKEEEMQRYRDQLQQKERNETEKEEEIQRYRDQLQQKERNETEKEEEVQRYRDQLQQKERNETEKEEEIQRYRDQLQQKERNETEKEEEVQRYRDQLQQKERNEAEKEEEMQRYRDQLQEKESELERCHYQLQEKDRRESEEMLSFSRLLSENDEKLSQSENLICVYQQQLSLTTSTDGEQWIISEDEVTLTEEELGRGSYAIVHVGIFRGLRVAVKSLHLEIISNYNLARFFREMSVASLIQHPNLVQFIGAIKVGRPLIVTELMDTSLYAEIHYHDKSHLTKQQIHCIAKNIALGLNYLHLFKPLPIIHRGISSSNVLLEFLGGGYKAKIGGYGSAIKQESCNNTTMPGNPSYAAPEAGQPTQHGSAMDVYSYSVLLMEMTLSSQPATSVAEREQQSHNISWSTMKSLVQNGLSINYKNRPTMLQVIESLKSMQV